MSLLHRCLCFLAFTTLSVGVLLFKRLTTGGRLGQPHFVPQTGLPGTSVVGVPWEMYGCLMIFSVHLPHGGHDEDNCITELALVSVIMQGPRIFSLAVTSTFNSHWRVVVEDNSRTPMPREVEDSATYEKNVRSSQLLKEFNCVVTHTWASCDAGAVD